MTIIKSFGTKNLFPPTASVNLNWRWYFDKTSVNTWKNIIFDFIHLMDKFWMQGNIEITNSKEWAYKNTVKKLIIEKNWKIQNVLFL